VEFFDTSGQYIASFYHGAGSVGSAQNVAVTPGGTTTGINEQMSKPVHPYSLTDSSSGINLGFTNLTGGTPSMSPQQVTLPSTAANFQLVGGACYDIHPSATYAGLVTVTIPYDPAQVAGDAWALKMLHYEGGTWKDITVSVDTLNHTVTGQTTSFSDFGVFEPHGSGSGGAPTSTPASSNWSLALLALSALGVVALVGHRVRNTSGA
jgi:hypothetical protein